MKRTIIAFKHYYQEFLDILNEKEKLKLKYILSLLETSDRMPLKFLRYIRNGLYELRLEYESNIYRIFFIFDEDKIVVLFNGFHKKTMKTPQKEIDKALKIKNEYYAYKQSHHNKYK